MRGALRWTRIQYFDGLPQSIAEQIQARRGQGRPSRMKNFLRLLRYGLPYTLEWLPGVCCWLSWDCWIHCA